MDNLVFFFSNVDGEKFFSWRDCGFSFWGKMVRVVTLFVYSNLFPTRTPTFKKLAVLPSIREADFLNSKPYSNSASSFDIHRRLRAIALVLLSLRCPFYYFPLFRFLMSLTSMHQLSNSLKLPRRPHQKRLHDKWNDMDHKNMVNAGIERCVIGP